MDNQPFRRSWAQTINSRKHNSIVLLIKCAITRVSPLVFLVWQAALVEVGLMGRWLRTSKQGGHA